MGKTRGLSSTGPLPMPTALYTSPSFGRKRRGRGDEETVASRSLLVQGVSSHAEGGQAKGMVSGQFDNPDGRCNCSRRERLRLRPGSSSLSGASTESLGSWWMVASLATWGKTRLKPRAVRASRRTLWFHQRGATTTSPTLGPRDGPVTDGDDMHYEHWDRGIRATKTGAPMPSGVAVDAAGNASRDRSGARTGSRGFVRA